MGHYYHSGNGNLQLLAGRGKAEYGASTVRKGTFSSPAISGESATVIGVTFDTPMPDADYMIDISRSSDDTTGLVFSTIKNKTKNGFQLFIARPYSSDIPAGAYSGTYTAFKLYTDNEYNNILASMPSNASASNKLMAEDEFVVVTANLRSESLPAGIGELYKDIPVPTGYSPFCIVDYDLGRLQGLNITGMSLAATIGQVRIATYCDRAITNELNGGIRVMCRKN